MLLKTIISNFSNLVMKKKILLSILIIFGIIFINGCYYVFLGQNKSMYKIRIGKELNAYECFSVYTMHTAMWMFFGWISPAAAVETFNMQFAFKDETDTIRHNNRLIKNSVLSNKVINIMKHLNRGQKEKLLWENEPYTFGFNHSREVAAALAVNGGTVSREIDKKTGKDCFFVRINNCWSKTAVVSMVKTRIFNLKINEGLYRYLQDKGILNNYNAEFCFPVEDIL